MKAMYKGDPETRPSEGPEATRLFGIVFPKGRFVTIPGDEQEVAKIAAKLSGNSHFVVEDGEGEATVELNAAEAADAATAAGRGTFDHDGKGGPGGSRKKADIIADLEALKTKYPDKVDYDPNLGAPKLSAILEGLKFDLGED